MPVISPSRSDLRTEETQYRSAVGEALLQKIGANINYIHDKDDEQDVRLTNVEADIAAIQISQSSPSSNFTVGARTFYYFYFAFLGGGATVTVDYPAVSVPNEVISGDNQAINLFVGPSTTLTFANGANLRGWRIDL